MIFTKINNAYAVYFLGVATHSREDVFASSKREAEAIIASKYGLAYGIEARLLYCG